MTLFPVRDVKNLGTGCSWEKEIDSAVPSTGDIGYRKWRWGISSIYIRSRNTAGLLHAHRQWRKELFVPTFRCQITTGFCGKRFHSVHTVQSLFLTSNKVNTSWMRNIRGPNRSSSPMLTSDPVPLSTLSSYHHINRNNMKIPQYERSCKKCGFLLTPLPQRQRPEWSGGIWIIHSSLNHNTVTYSQQQRFPNWWVANSFWNMIFLIL
jgi:hypothetical protein